MSYYERNKQQILESRRRYYKENRERILAKNRKAKQEKYEDEQRRRMEFQRANFKICYYEDGIKPF